MRDFGRPSSRRRQRAEKIKFSGRLPKPARTEKKEEMEGGMSVFLAGRGTRETAGRTSKTPLRCLSGIPRQLVRSTMCNFGLRSKMSNRVVTRTKVDAAGGQRQKGKHSQSATLALEAQGSTRRNSQETLEFFSRRTSSSEQRARLVCRSSSTPVSSRMSSLNFGSSRGPKSSLASTSSSMVPNAGVRYEDLRGTSERSKCW